MTPPCLSIQAENSQVEFLEVPLFIFLSGPGQRDFSFCLSIDKHLCLCPGRICSFIANRNQAVNHHTDGGSKEAPY